MNNKTICICSNFNCENQDLTIPYSACMICGYVMEPIEDCNNLIDNNGEYDE